VAMAGRKKRAQTCDFVKAGYINIKRLRFLKKVNNRG
jgi:hypothetical protein